MAICVVYINYCYLYLDLGLSKPNVNPSSFNFQVKARTLSNRTTSWSKMKPNDMDYPPG